LKVGIVYSVQMYLHIALIMLFDTIFSVNCIKLMLTTITECVVLEISIFCYLFDTLFYRFFTHYTASYNPSTESSIGKFTSCFF